jgi:hypothetical protein
MERVERRGMCGHLKMDKKGNAAGLIPTSRLSAQATRDTRVPSATFNRSASLRRTLEDLSTTGKGRLLGGKNHC